MGFPGDSRFLVGELEEEPQHQIRTRGNVDEQEEEERYDPVSRE
jgi:hypothetical protein